YDQVYIGSGNADALMRGNRIHDPLNPGASAIQLSAAPRARILDNDIFAAGSGVYLYSSGGLPDAVRIEARGNRIHDNTSYGVLHGSSAVIAGNSIFRNGGWAVSSTGEVTGNEIFANANGVNASTYVHGNRIYANTGVGVQDGTSVEANTIYSNTVGVQMTYF